MDLNIKYMYDTIQQIFAVCPKCD